MSELIDAQKNAPQPGSVTTVAWFSMQGKDQTHIFFADKNDPANGDIDPVFLLAAYVLEDKPHRSGAKTYYGITTGYDVADEWKKAFAGISHLASAQSSEDKMEFENLRKDKNLPAGKQQSWTKISLSSKVVAAPSAPSTGLVDDIFVPQRSRFGTTDEDFMLIGNPIWGTHTIPRLYMMAAIILESSRNASVVSLVVDKRGIIAAHGIKRPTDGGCGHAEVKAIFSLKGKLPDSGAVFGTLKPCTMCAGLLHATDPAGKLRKYWVRDDANFAADWSGISKGFQLGNGHQLDKNCENVKFLKTSNGGSFFEEFTGVRKQSQITSEAKKAKPEQERQWYGEWANRYVFPKGPAPWSSLRFRSGQAVTDDNVKTKLIEMTVNGTTTLETFVLQHLAFKDYSPKNQKGWNGMDNTSAAKIKDAWKQYRDDQFAAAFSSQVIKIIPWNPDSVALSKSARDAFKAKQKKYTDPEFRNPHVKAVLDYLTSYLSQMNVKI